MKQGYVQVYTGDGKGKTTAAVGLAMRAAAAGLRVYFCQFMKYGPTGELDAFRLFGDRIVAEQFGTGGELSAPDPEDDAQAARRVFFLQQGGKQGGGDARQQMGVDDVVDIARARVHGVAGGRDIVGHGFVQEQGDAVALHQAAAHVLKFHGRELP